MSFLSETLAGSRFMDCRVGVVSAVRLGARRWAISSNLQDLSSVETREGICRGNQFIKCCTNMGSTRTSSSELTIVALLPCKPVRTRRPGGWTGICQGATSKWRSLRGTRAMTVPIEGLPANMGRQQDRAGDRMGEGPCDE